MKKIYLSIVISLLFSSQLFSQCAVNGTVTSPSCIGLCNGRIAVIPSGGKAPYHYTWSNGDTTRVITGLCADSYTVTVTDAATCNVTHVFTVAPATPLTATVAVENEPCYGDATGAAVVTPHGGTAPYTYSWNTTPVQTTRIARGLPPGIYTVTVTTTGGCSATATATISQPAQLVAHTTSTNSACDSSTGSVSVTVSGGTVPYSYIWNTIFVSTTATVTGLASGDYGVLVRDSAGCTVTSTVIVGNADGLSATAIHTNISCRGEANGRAVVTATGGTAPYSYSWSSVPVQTTDTASGLIAGRYKVTVTDSGGCSFSTQVTITQPATALSVTATHTNDRCFGGAGAAALASAAGGTAPYSYSWSTTPIQTTRVADNLVAGTYTVTVTDANSCTATKTVTIAQPATGVSATITSTNVTCFGAGNGTAVVTATGGTPGYTYRWNDGKATRAITGLGIGTYRVLVTDRNGCTTTDSVTITRPPQIIIAVTVDSATCGVSNGAASAVVTSGGVSPFTYLWLPAGGTNSIATGLPAGVYEIRVTDSNGCSSAAAAVIPNAGAGTAAITASKNISCRGGNDGSATVTMTGGVQPYTYIWTTTPVQTTATATGLTAGTYGVSVKDANGCLASAVVRIMQPATTITSSITAHTNVICAGDSTGTATVTAIGGTPPYTYSWSTTPVQTTRKAINLKAGEYSVAVTDSNGCEVVSTVRITQSPGMVLTSTFVNPTCYGESDGEALVTVTGGIAPFTYSWSTTPPQTTRAIINLKAGTYTVTVTEGSGCSKAATVNITQPNKIVLNTTTTNTTCGQSNGSATVNVASGGVGPFTYSWTTTPVQTTATATGLAANVYTITVVDSKGCSAMTTAIVSSTNAATASVSVSNVVCYGQSNGSASVSLTGGTSPFTYAWTTFPVQTTDTATGLMAGSYGVIITDHNGCQTAANAVVGQPDTLTAINSVKDVSCFGGNNGSASAVISGGNGGYSYNWNTAPVQSTDTATGLSAGNFILTVTDSKGCMLSDAVAIDQPAQSLEVNASQLQTTCSGSTNGLAMATVTGGNPPYSYSWNSSPAQTSDTATGLAAGTYTVTVTDSLGCSNNATATIVAASPITATITPINVTCFGYANGRDSVNATGGTPSYSYSWNSSPVQNTAVATTLPAGSYTVTITDMNGCSATYSNTITEPEAAVTLTIATANATCDSINGKVSAHVSGGTSPYTYLWNTSPAQTTDTASGLAAGTYIITVTDINGCSNTDEATIANTGAGRDSITSVTDPTCYGGDNGSATVTVIGGTKPFTYSWNTSPVQTTATATNLTANSYIITATDSNGCKSSENVFISQPQPIVPVTTSANINCNGGAATGMTSVAVTGGNLPFTFSWNTNPVQTKDTAINLAVGNYTVTVTDASGCTATAAAVISQPSPVIAVTSQTPVRCNGNSNGVAIVYPDGGTPPYSFLWSTTPQQDSMMATGLPAGIYSVTISDMFGCTATVKDTITQPSPILLTTSGTNTSACNLANGTATVDITGGGVYPFTYFSWSPSGATTPVDSNLAAGLYTVMVTDANNCVDSAYAIVNSSGAGTDILTTVNDSCYGEDIGSATVTMIGGTKPFTYVWNTVPVQNTPTATGLSAGDYFVAVYDAAGCVSDILVTITQPDAITFTDTVVNASCLTCADGSAKIYPSGGTPPFTYSWQTTPTQTTQKATNLLPGVYNFCITDANGCQYCDTISVGVGGVGVLNLSSNSDTKMIVYPNPTSGQFTLEFESRTYGSQSQDLSVSIINLVGQEIYSEKINTVGYSSNGVNQTGKVSKTYNLSDYPKGMYLIQIISNERVYIGRIILE